MTLAPEFRQEPYSITHYSLRYDPQAGVVVHVSRGDDSVVGEGSSLVSEREAADAAFTDFMAKNEDGDEPELEEAEDEPADEPEPEAKPAKRASRAKAKTE